MKSKNSSKIQDKKGFTLIELVIVIALGAMITAGVTVLITQGRQATVTSVAGERIRTIQAGLSEYKMYKGSFPLQAASNTTWPAAIQAYAPADYQAAGAAPHGYTCDATSKSVTIRTPAFASAAEGGNARTKLLDSGVCDSTSPALTAAFEVDCIIPAYKSTAGCI